MTATLIRTALVALVAATVIAPIAIAQAGSAPNTRAISHASAVAQGPGGCVSFNEALDQAVATQLRTGKHAEARRLASLRQPCATR
jgi:hypothetical protein